MRVRGKASFDGSTGWVTVAGNQGTTYLEEGGNNYKVVVESELQDDDNPDEPPRKLKKGDLFEAFGWKKLENGMRLWGRAKEDGSFGNVNTTDGKGTVHLQI